VASPVVAPRIERLARICALAVAGLGLAVLAGWIFDVSRLRGPIPGLIEMKANTAIAFLMLGASLSVLARREVDPRLRALGRALAGAAALIGALSLAEYLLGRNLGIDQLLFHDGPEGPSDPTVNPGRLAPQTAIGFMLAGAALATLDSHGRRRVAGEVFALTGAGVALLALIGYAYSSGELQAVATLQPIALHTAGALLVLCLGIVLARPERGALASLRGDGTGSVVARRLLPVVFVALPVVGWLRVWGEHAGLYDNEASAALLIVAFLAMLTAGTLATAHKLNKVDRGQRESDRAVRESQMMLQAITDNTTSLIHVLDTDGCYRFVNRPFEERFGVPGESPIGKTVHDIFPDEVADSLRANDRLVMRAGRALELEERRPGEDGPHTYISIKFPLVVDGQLLGVGGVSTDITERKRAEDTARQAGEEAGRANRAKTEFLSRMSHELRTPLAAVIGFGQLLEMAALDERQRKSVEQILKGGRHLLDLINELLDISRIESGSMAISIEPVEVGQIVEEALTLIEPIATARSIRLIPDHEPAT
jgi:PAS domain S-box-containing protein